MTYGYGEINSPSTELKDIKTFKISWEIMISQAEKKTRGLMVLVILVILAIAILLALFNRVEEPKTEQPDDKIGLNMEIDKIETIDKTTTVHKL